MAWVKLALSFSMLLRMASPGVRMTPGPRATSVNWSIAVDLPSGDDTGHSDAA
ncbi:hypothetical protein [Rhizobium gallicum]|uniref:hypothetical protein n=1 Tax=Rhizobium gallicum TaxID=56730 RepID=UPI001EF91CEB|nr:hypothetical protein [Rhizobium gallicum]ULJ74441.1 hypothetical protein L2W42_21485 [Rhizobium gallicum]